MVENFRILKYMAMIYHSGFPQQFTAFYVIVPAEAQLALLDFKW
jgi:hypothetical protein